MTSAEKRNAKATQSDVPDPRFAPVAEAFAGDPDVTHGRIMAAFGLKVRGRIFAMLVRNELVVKLPKSRVDALVANGDGKPFQPRPGRAMKEWAIIELPPERWLAIAREAYAFVKGG
jgi:TfoX/Sxy family transcriptional regulator of competence genes